MLWGCMSWPGERMGLGLSKRAASGFRWAAWLACPGLSRGPPSCGAAQEGCGAGALPCSAHSTRSAAARRHAACRYGLPAEGEVQATPRPASAPTAAEQEKAAARRGSAGSLSDSPGHEQAESRAGAEPRGHREVLSTRVLRRCWDDAGVWYSPTCRCWRGVRSLYTRWCGFNLSSKTTRNAHKARCCCQGSALAAGLFAPGSRCPLGFPLPPSLITSVTVRVIPLAVLLRGLLLQLIPVQA